MGSRAAFNVWTGPAFKSALARVCLLVLVLGFPIASGGVVALPQAQNEATDYSGKPPFTADELWTAISQLLNEHNGGVTKERLEQMLGVRFSPPERQTDADVYVLRSQKDWYFDVRLILYNDRFRAPWDPASNGEHVQWYIGWRADTFGNPAQTTCLTDERVRDGLLATGWSSPWLRWGFWEELASRPAGAPSLRVPPVSNFFRQADWDAGHRDRLPNGTLETTGDWPDSCVTSIVVTAPR